MSINQLALWLRIGRTTTDLVLRHHPELYGWACGYLDGINATETDSAIWLATDDYANGYRNGRMEIQGQTALAAR